jgi:hypothetical protein
VFHTLREDRLQQYILKSSEPLILPPATVPLQPSIVPVTIAVDLCVMGEGVDLGSQSVAGATFSSGFLHALAVAGSAVPVFPARACLIRLVFTFFPSQVVQVGPGQ